MIHPSYSETIFGIINAARKIRVTKTLFDGRIESAVKEVPFLQQLKHDLSSDYPDWEVVIQPPRASCDLMVNSLRINLKLTDCKTSDNSMNKPSIFYSITGLSDYPYSSNWNEFLFKLQDSSIKKTRDRTSEYHYLVKNKLNNDVMIKAIFDIHTYVRNPSNDLQINWKNEFYNLNYVTSDDQYTKKVKSLLLCIQRSVNEMISRTKHFAEADFTTLLESGPLKSDDDRS